MSFFTELFSSPSLHPQDRRVQRCAVEVTWIMVLALMDATSDRLTSEDRAELIRLTNDKKTDAALGLIQQRYSKDEWEALIQRTLGPMLEDYKKKVLEPDGS